MEAAALWRRLDTPGRDAARVRRRGEGWTLEGMAVFADAAGPAAVRYQVELDAGWRTERGRIDGIVGARDVRRRVERGADGWTLDGVPQPEVAGLLDLDFGFTPATNFCHLRRAGPAEGQAVDIVAAWYDLGEAGLAPLPQRYAWLSADRLAYESQTHGYRATLILAPSGFVRSYPGLWEMEG